MPILYSNSIIGLRTQATSSSTSTNYASVAYDLLPHKMVSETLTVESNSKLRISYLVYMDTAGYETNFAHLIIVSYN